MLRDMIMQERKLKRSERDKENMVLEEEIIIVGAGIAGLATAVVLKRVGIRALVLEKSDVDDRKSTSRYVFLLSKGAVAWSSKKQPVVTLSTTEAEFVAAASCACQGVWMRRVLEKLGHSQGKCTTVLCDNSSTIKLSKNPVMHGRSKHIDVRFHFLRDLTREGVVELKHCGTQEQVADIMTKPLKLDVFLKLRELLGVSVVPRVN